MRARQVLALVVPLVAMCLVQSVAGNNESCNCAMCCRVLRLRDSRVCLFVQGAKKGGTRVSMVVATERSRLQG